MEQDGATGGRKWGERKDARGYQMMEKGWGGGRGGGAE